MLHQLHNHDVKKRYNKCRKVTLYLDYIYFLFNQYQIISNHCIIKFL
jgi:hypothetical protein